MALDIVQAGDPVLRQAAAPVDVSHIGTEAFNELIAEMVETMHLAPGVGLAAPQVGLPVQLIVIEDRPETIEDMDEEFREERARAAVPLTVLVNPTIEFIGREKATFFEGCLSVHGWMAETERHFRVKVKALNEKGEKIELDWSGWPARILQHEIDHLRGTLYIDKMDSRTFTFAPSWEEDDEDWEDDDDEDVFDQDDE